MVKMKDTNIILSKVCKAKGKQSGNNNKQVNQKWSNKRCPKQNNDDKYAWKKVTSKKINNETISMNDKAYN